MSRGPAGARRDTLALVARGLRVCGVVAVAMLALWPIGEPQALTPPMGGAVSMPGDFAMSLPFPEGAPVRASCAYGPGCSGFHVNTNVACCTNDYYALDLVRDQAGNGDGEPITAMASGTVIYADWATGGFSSFGRYVAIEHDYVADGHAYFSIYAHLSSIAVGVGEHVEMKQTLGNLGGSSNMLDGQFGAHVHVAVYQDANLGNGGMHGGLAVIPEPIDGYEDLAHGTVMVAGAAPVPPNPGGTGTGGDTGGDSATDSGGDAAGDGPGPATSAADSGGNDDAAGDDATPGDGSGDGDGDGADTSSPGDGGEALPGASGGRGGDDGGCACRTTSSPGPGPLSVSLMLWLFLRRRDR